MSYIYQLYSTVADALSSPFRYVYKQAKCFAYASLYVCQGRVSVSTAVHMATNGLWGFVIDGRITIEQFINLNFCAAIALENEGVRQFIIDGRITVEQFIALNVGAAIALENEGVRQLIIDGRITIEQFIALNYNAVSALKNEGVRQFIIDGRIRMGQFIALNSCAVSTLEKKGVQQFIINGRITIEQFIALNGGAAIALRNESVRQFIIDGCITMEQFIALDGEAADALQNEGVRQFIIDGRITIQDFIALDYHAASALKNHGVQQLIIDGRMTFNQLSLITIIQLFNAITDPNTIERINALQLTVDHVIGALRQPAMLNAYNRAQNTHTASVHQSVSESAKKLYARYKDLIAGENLYNVIALLKDTVFEYASPIIGKYNNRERDCLEPAKAGLKRLTAVDYTFTDASSEVSTRQLLAMAYLAIQDNKDDGVKALIRGLYEVEREYNVDKPDSDNDANTAINACPGGTFNKIIEKLVGISPECSVVFVDKETVASKFRIILLDNIAQHLVANAEISDEVFSDDDWNKIWQAVKKDVKEQAHEEHSEVESELKIQVLRWIEENIAGFDCGYCLLSKDDMKKIKDKLAKLQAKPAAPSP